jgi:ribonuclease Y
MENIIVYLIISFFAGGCIGYFVSIIFTSYQKKKIKEARENAEQILKQAKKEAEDKKKEIVISAKEEAHKILMQAEKELKERRTELQKIEKRILQKEENLEKKEEFLEKKEKEIKEIEEEIKENKIKAEKMLENASKELEKIAELTKEEARKLLLKNIEDEIRLEAAKLVKEIEQQAKEEAERKAREIVSLAIQKCAVDQMVESSVSVVQLPSDEMKGRLIGREGRNIRTFETLTGVDLIVDDTPEAVVISCFDPVRREIARIALEKLIKDGRIQPARIEEVVEKSRQEIEEKIMEEGKNAVLKVGIGGIHPELVKLLGKLYYRTSYGQNVLLNSIEAAFLAGTIASELGVDVMLAKRAALLHDIGKAVTAEVEGPHALIGAEIASRYGESKGVVHAIAAHHGEEDPQTIEAVIVQVADAISAARPGARRETWETYVKRLEKLEQLADSFPGVEKAYAIQAGREIRIMVKPEEIDDFAAMRLAKEISEKIENELQYPGQIKIVVIRETRAIEYAK